MPIHAEVAARLAALGEIDVNPGPEPWSPEELRDRCAGADALMAFMTERVDAALLDAAPRLRVVAGALKGPDNIDLAACAARGVAVTVEPDLLTAPTAELTVGLAIAALRHLTAGDRLVRGGGFRGWRAALYGGTLDGATVGLVGCGAVGRAVLRRLAGFGCRLLFADPHVDGCEGAARCGRDEILERSDVVILAAPLRPDTLHVVDADALARLRPGALLVNPARGSLVDEAAVAAALQDGRLGGYAADVFEMEDRSRPDAPLGVHPGLLNAPNTVLTPHLGSAVARVRAAIEMSAAESIAAVLSGAAPPPAKRPASVGSL